MNALEVKNLTKQYKDFKLDNVSFTLPSGYIMGFIGENGAGKSTTISLILELIKKDGGEVNILGSGTLCPVLKENIGVVMDECGFPENLNAANVCKIMKSCYKTWNNETFEHYIHMFDLPSTKKLKEYSRGMKMKLSIAAALSHDSKLLILDEATSGLDPIVRNEILDVFMDFIQDENHSIFISSHIISDLEKICDYITFIHKGKIVFSKSKDELLDKYVIAKCTQAQYEAIDKTRVSAARKSKFDVEVLAEKNSLPSGIVTQRVTIEDIMLYYVKQNEDLTQPL